MRCDTACTLSGDGTVTPRAKPKKRKGHKAPKPVVARLTARPRKLAAGQSTVLRLTLSKRDALRLRRALGRLRGLDADVQLLAGGDIGEPTTQALDLRPTS